MATPHFPEPDPARPIPQNPSKRSTAGSRIGVILLVLGFALGALMLAATLRLFWPATTYSVEAGESISLDEGTYYFRGLAEEELNDIDIVITHESGEQSGVLFGLYGDPLFEHSGGGVSFDQDVTVTADGGTSGFIVILFFFLLMGWLTAFALAGSGTFLWFWGKR